MNVYKDTPFVFTAEAQSAPRFAEAETQVFANLGVLSASAVKAP